MAEKEIMTEVVCAAMKCSVISSDLTNDSPFDSLPPEVVSYIFEFLPYQDLKSARLVCMVWYMASLAPRLTDRDKCVLRVSREAGPLSYGIPLDRFQRLRDSKRHFYHIDIRGNAVAWCDVKFFSFYGQNIRSLNLWPSVQSENDLFPSLHHCCNLRSLSLRIEKMSFKLEQVPRFSDGLSLEFPSLERLELFGLSIDNFGTFHLITSKAPCLKSVSISGILLGNSACLEFTTYLQQFSDRTFDLSFRFLRECCVSMSIAKNLGDQTNSNVRVSVCEFHLMPSPGYLQIWCQSALKELELSKYLRVTDEILTTICKNCVNLEKFISGNFRKVTKAVREMSALTKLSILTLGQCGTFDNECLLQGLCSEVNKNLKEVDIHSLKAPLEFYIEFARTHPAVTNLSFRRCDGLTDFSVQAIFKYQTSVEVLRITCCPGVKRAGCIGETLIASCNIPGMRYPWGTSVHENPTGYSIGRLAGLRLLDLRSTEADFDFFHYGVKFTNLTGIGTGHTNISMDTLEVLIENHPKIKSIDLTRLPITDDFLRLLIKKLPALENVVIDDCKNITDDGCLFLIARGISLSGSYWPWRGFVNIPGEVPSNGGAYFREPI